MENAQDNQKPARIPSQNPGGVRAEISRLEAVLNQHGGLLDKISDAFDINAEIYTDSFKALEAQIHVTQRVVSDALTGKELHLFKVDEEHGIYQIDWGYYFIEYMVCDSFTAFVHGLVSLSKKEDTSPAQASGDVVVFGG